jgi:N-acylneuraminate cytidylyltransferase
MVKKGPDGTFSLVNETAQTLGNRQSTPEVFDMTTVCYVVNSNFVLSNSGIFKGRVKAVMIPPERAIDIDTEFDFQVAEALVKSGRIVL